MVRILLGRDWAPFDTSSELDPFGASKKLWGIKNKYKML